MPLNSRSNGLAWSNAARLNDFDGAVGAHDIAGEPDFAVTAAADGGEEFVITDVRDSSARLK
jgi:hypothetical protein